MTLFIVNAWDGRIAQESNRSLTTGLNVNWTPNESSVFNYNYLGGAEATDNGRRDLHELNGKVDLSESWTAGADFHYVTQTQLRNDGEVYWFGGALYARVKLAESSSISARYEYFDDTNGGFAIVGGLAQTSTTRQAIQALTLTNSFVLGDGVEMRLEVRADRSSSNQFFKAQDGGPSYSQESATVAFLYGF